MISGLRLKRQIPQPAFPGDISAVRAKRAGAMATSYVPTDGKWEVLRGAQPVLDEIRSRMSAEEHEQQKRALQEFLCAYFNSGDCTKELGKSISPVGMKTGKGGKVLKVRWGIPGSGKSAGLRLAVVVYCKELRVKIAGAWIRKDDPPDGEFEKAVLEA